MMLQCNHKIMIATFELERCANMLIKLFNVAEVKGAVLGHTVCQISKQLTSARELNQN